MYMYYKMSQFLVLNLPMSQFLVTWQFMPYASTKSTVVLLPFIPDKKRNKYVGNPINSGNYSAFCKPYTMA